MTNLQTVNPDRAAGKTKALLEAVRKALGIVPNLFRVAANSPAALEGLLNLNGALGNGTFNAQLRERIALVVAEANGCAYCLSAHTALGLGAGLTRREVDAARVAEASDGRTAAILRFARRVVEGRGTIPNVVLRETKSAGLSDGEIVEVIANVVVNIFTNYLNIVANTDIDFPVVMPRVAKAA
jgi:uncharacterized peroxidase-related enzyme